MCCLGLCLHGCGGGWRIFRSHVCDGINVHRGLDTVTTCARRACAATGTMTATTPIGQLIAIHKSCVPLGVFVRAVFKVALNNNILAQIFTCYALPRVCLRSLPRPIRCGGNGCNPAATARPSASASDTERTPHAYVHAQPCIEPLGFERPLHSGGRWPFGHGAQN
jgi:hypothetical protein